MKQLQRVMTCIGKALLILGILAALHYPFPSTAPQAFAEQESAFAPYQPQRPLTDSRNSSSPSAVLLVVPIVLALVAVFAGGIYMLHKQKNRPVIVVDPKKGRLPAQSDIAGEPAPIVIPPRPPSLSNLPDHHYQNYVLLKTLYHEVSTATNENFVPIHAMQAHFTALYPDQHLDLEDIAIGLANTYGGLLHVSPRQGIYHIQVNSL